MSRIMIADDESAVATQLDERLTRMGHRVVGFSVSGEGAVEMARELKPDIVLMDIVMPGMLDGIDAAGIILDELDIPVIFITAYTDNYLIEKVKEVEPFGYMIKPFKTKEIEASIDIALYRKEMERKLRRSEEKYRTILESIEDGYFEVDLEGNLTFCNDSECGLLGYSRDELIGMNYRHCMDKANADWANKIALKVFYEKQAVKVADWEIIRKDGSRRIHSGSLSLLKDLSGRSVGFMGIARDVTENKLVEEQVKASLREKEILLKEINHRVKNNFTIIDSLLNLEMGQVKNNESKMLLKDIKNRIRTMSIVHGKLGSTGDLKTIDLGIYIRDISSELYRTYVSNTDRIVLNIDACSLQLAITKAIPCGLILNELLTNAFKYAFPESLHKQGRVVVSLRERDGRLVELKVSDNGIGLHQDGDIKKTDSLGLQLVQVLAENQLKGSFKLRRQNGAKFTVRFPK